MSFQIRDTIGDLKYWKQADDYDRLEKFTDTEANDQKIIFKLGLSELE